MYLLVSAAVHGRCPSCATDSELASAEAVRLPGLLAGVWGAEHEAEAQAVHTSRRVYYLWKKKNTSMSWISHFHLKEDGREKSVS